MISWSDFEKIDIRIGKIIKAEEFPEARKPAFKLVIDFGVDVGVKKSSAQITNLYSMEELVGKHITAVTNFPSKQIGPFVSECLVLGCYNEKGEVVLLQPERNTPLGSRIG